MANRFEGRGNLGTDPILKQVNIDGEKRPLAEMRIYFDRSIPDGDGGFDDKGGFWLTINLWGERAAHLAELLPKGARVHVFGTLVRDTWKDRESGKERERMELVADHVSLDLGRVEEFKLQQKDETS